jgi:hypothetical protein
MSDEKFVFDSLQDSETIKSFLTSLTNGDAIELKPDGLLNFVVKARKKGSENKLSIKVEWKDAAKGKKDADDTLQVS